MSPEEEEKNEENPSILKLHIYTSRKYKTDVLQPQKELTDGNLRSSSKYKKERREIVSWSDEEIDALQKGVEKYGYGKWKAIFLDLDFKFHTSRNPSDLKDKYRLLTKKTSYYALKKQDFVVVDNEWNYLTDSLGKYDVYKEKFPHDACERAAILHCKSTLDGSIIRLMSLSNQSVMHVYEVFIIEEGCNKYKVRKISTLTRST
ncbi:hypothetical protein CWI38_0299p0040 [Hamiltosporidium tvaerminnensis]|uniref:Myb-like domain-containing protein n=2 Tax=Hamiltosporidium TaxID=1176354 RepID=A0A4Q9L0N9_9MICR|nr:hypothetical protein LUQ84_001478 [Hamiltosporidium tvaerminnensis]TBU00894.1 hypothetical protein CWI37_0867p0020 [Hamiltosporidium tvaerminnensis]TBU08129.1 hypothetical protein CWI36_0178p0030 [Hamiltosporidium magnivora]TBU13740.1 hypothetical protein CWI38_0348p0030 [Hamiltosporidium tvaerminnensis]TBU16189.1 hypothetical protein CWI38_0299p0040 [Hamiltosporidium tvaerminnensis]